MGQKHIALLPPSGEQELNLTDNEKRTLRSSDPLPIIGKEISPKFSEFFLRS